MLSAGVRVARLMLGHVPPLHWIWKDLCEALEAHRVVCRRILHRRWPRPRRATPTPDGGQVPRDRPGPPESAAYSCRTTPAGWGFRRRRLALLHRTANVYLDITSVVDYWREAARRIGPSRVVFATGMPFYDPATFVSERAIRAQAGHAGQETDLRR